MYENLPVIKLSELFTHHNKKVETEQKITPNNKARLKSLYDDAIKESSKVDNF